MSLLIDDRIVLQRIDLLASRRGVSPAEIVRDAVQNELRFHFVEHEAERPLQNERVDNALARARARLVPPEKGGLPLSDHSYLYDDDGLPIW